MKPHLKWAHELWSQIVHPQDHLIDATCGNGHDTAFLASLVPKGQVFALDLQIKALKTTQKRLSEKGLDHLATLLHQSHQTFPSSIPDQSIKLIVYNLGYLPGGDKSFTTMTHTTLQSIQNGIPLLKPGGVISLTLYPGHPEGEKEAKELLNYAKTLPEEKWTVEHRVWGTEYSPSLLIFNASFG